MTTSLQIQQTVLVIALASIYPLQSRAASTAGVAQFTAGEVNVRRPDGGTAPLSKGKDLESGESILTGINGRAQVKFTDGGLISLQPNTEFKIASYVDKADPKEDRFLVDLLRGSMRAITGLIGKRNRENYKVNTATATIGIRGSGFNVGYNPDGSVGVTTEFDSIEVCNAGGCVGLTAGESVRVVNSAEAPVRTNVKASLPTPGPEQEPTVAGNQTNAEGKTTQVTTTTETKTTTTTTTKTTTTTTTETKIDGKVSNTGTFTDLRGIGHFHTALNSTDQGGTFVVAASNSAGSGTLDAGKATSILINGSTFDVTTSAESGSRGTIADNNFIGWGNWVTGTKSFNGTTSNIYHNHYLVGQPTATLPTTGNVFANYVLVGGTNPTSYTGTSGTLTSATLQVNFDPTQIGGRLLKFNAATSFGTISQNFVYFSSSSVTSPDSKLYVLFTGANAVNAGVLYNGTIVSGNGAVGGTFTGVAVFRAP